jgi:hypothetical protein
MGPRYAVPQVTAISALVGGLNRHLDTVGVRGTRPPAEEKGGCLSHD